VVQVDLVRCGEHRRGLRVVPGALDGFVQAYLLARAAGKA